MNGGFTHQTPFENRHILALELNISSLSLFCFLFFCLFPSLSLQAVKLTTLQPIWRTWNEDFGVSALAFEFVLWWWTQWSDAVECAFITTMNRDLSLVEACLHLDISSVSTTTKKLIFQISIIYILLYLKESKVQVLFLYEVKIGQLFLFVNKENRKCGVTGTSLFTFSCYFLLFLVSLLLPAVTARECGLLLHLCSREKQTNAGLYDLLYSNNENCFDFWHFLG